MVSQANVTTHFTARVLIYASILTLLILGLLTSLWLRTPFRVNVVRDRGVMARITDDGMIENVYRLQIMNGTETTQHFQLSVNGLKGLEIEEDEVKDADYSEHKKDEKHAKDAKDAGHDKDAKHADDNKTIMVQPAESRWIIVDLKIPDGSVESGSHKFSLRFNRLKVKKL